MWKQEHTSFDVASCVWTMSSDDLAKRLHRPDRSTASATQEPASSARACVHETVPETPEEEKDVLAQDLAVRRDGGLVRVVEPAGRCDRTPPVCMGRDQVRSHDVSPRGVNRKTGCARARTVHGRVWLGGLLQVRHGARILTALALLRLDALQVDLRPHTRNAPGRAAVRGRGGDARLR